VHHLSNVSRREFTFKDENDGVDHTIKIDKDYRHDVTPAVMSLLRVAEHTFIKAAQASNAPSTQLLFRALRCDENPSSGLQPADEAATYTATEHVEHGSNVQTQFISLSSSIVSALFFGAKGCLSNERKEETVRIAVFSMNSRAAADHLARDMVVGNQRAQILSREFDECLFEKDSAQRELGLKCIIHVDTSLVDKFRGQVNNIRDFTAAFKSSGLNEKLSNAMPSIDTEDDIHIKASKLSAQPGTSNTSNNIIGLATLRLDDQQVIRGAESILNVKFQVYRADLDALHPLSVYQSDTECETILVTHHPLGSGRDHFDLTRNPRFTKWDIFACPVKATKFSPSEHIIDQIQSVLLATPFKRGDHISGISEWIPKHLLFNKQFLLRLFGGFLPSILELMLSRGFDMTGLRKSQTDPVVTESKQHYNDSKIEDVLYLIGFINSIENHLQCMSRLAQSEVAGQSAKTFANRFCMLHKNEDDCQWNSILYPGMTSQPFETRMVQHATLPDGGSALHDIMVHLGSAIFQRPMAQLPGYLLETGEALFATLLVACSNRTRVSQGKELINGMTSTGSAPNVVNCGVWAGSREAENNDRIMWLNKNCGGLTGQQSILSALVPGYAKSYAMDFAKELFDMNNLTELHQVTISMVQKMQASHGGKAKKNRWNGLNITKSDEEKDLIQPLIDIIEPVVDNINFTDSDILGGANDKLLEENLLAALRQFDKTSPINVESISFSRSRTSEFMDATKDKRGQLGVGVDDDFNYCNVQLNYVVTCDSSTLGRGLRAKSRAHVEMQIITRALLNAEITHHRNSTEAERKMYLMNLLKTVVERRSKKRKRD